MFRQSAELYDLIYSSFKDYREEAAQIAALLRVRHPNCRTVLDAGCGTGEHARLLAADGFVVDGIDLDPAFVSIASRKNLNGRFVEGDMADFHLGRRYDAVLCLFSSIGYVCSLARLGETLRCFREHVTPAGVVVVEPWFQPGDIDPMRVTRQTAEGDGLRVTRTARIGVDGRLSTLVFDYEVIDTTGTRTFREEHELGLFTVDEMQDAFRNAGLDAAYDPIGPGGRGLFVARTAG